MLIIKAMINRLLKTPVKSILTILSISLGVMIVSLVLNLNDKLLKIKNSSSDKSIFHVINGEMTGEYSVEYNYPSLFTRDVINNIENELDGIIDLTAINSRIDNPISYKNEKYRPSAGYAVDPSYLTMNNIDILEGDIFTQNSNNKEVLISQEVKEFIFGKENCIGESLSVQWYDDEYEEGEINFKDFTISGVYKTPTRSENRTSGIPDMIYSIKDFNYSELSYGLISIKVENSEVENFKVKLEQYLKSTLGSDNNFLIWNGNPSDIHSFENNDDMIIFIVFFSILAMVGLIISSFGVFSMTMVAVLERNKEVGLKRALGGTRAVVIKDFLIESIMIILLGSIIGIILSAIFTPLFITNVIPGVSFGMEDHLTGMSLTLNPISTLISVGITVIFGAIFGLFPSLTAAKTTPIEAIREN